MSREIIPVESVLDVDSELKIVNDQKEIDERYSAYLMDESRIPAGEIEGIMFPESENQVVEAIEKASSIPTQITVSAGRTGIVGGAVPSKGMVVSLEKMDRFLGARWDDTSLCWCVRIDPGLTLDTLNNKLNKKDFSAELSGLEGENRDQLLKFSEESDQWFYPVDPTEKSAHVGGTVATNASGARSFKFGPTRNFVVSLRVVLADGTILSIPRGKFVDETSAGFSFNLKNGNSVKIPIPDYKYPNVKNTAGYFFNSPMDFIDYFIGSEGTLGIITQVELALMRKPEMKLGVVAYFDSEDDAVHFVTCSREKGRESNSIIDPTVLEYFDTRSLNLLREKRKESAASEIPPFPDTASTAVYFEQDGREDDLDGIFTAYEELLLQCHTSMDNTWGAVDDRELKKMRIFRHALPEAVNSLIGQRQLEFPKLHKVGTDFSVPDSALKKMFEIYHCYLDKAEFDYLIFGHIGENHLHVNILPKNEEELKKAKEIYLSFAKEAVALGGTVSGEHGIGKIKKAMLSVLYSETEIVEMKRIKTALDPQGILGPGNIF